MELTEQVCSLEFAKRLKELGVKQESLFYWSSNLFNNLETFSVEKPVIVDSDYVKQMKDDYGVTYVASAFTVAELGEMLPYGCYSRPATSGRRGLYFRSGWFNMGRFHRRKHPLKRRTFFSNTEANSRADLLIYLIEKGIVKP